ncbi:MAG: AAA family ATPase [Candidatus Zixiibacteriota bacterium]
MAKDKDDIKAVESLQNAATKIKEELSKIIVGQTEVIEQVLITMLSGGHALIVGVPGLAKTMMINSISKALDLEFHRIQFTPDLMPSDITGTEIIEEDRSTGKRAFKFVKGPIFSNIVLADEINRTPPKTQAALLQAMQEHRVTVGDITHKLPEPFFVLATQNPIEQEGTYPLPEAQLDRFMFMIMIYYPSKEEEQKIVAQNTSLYSSEISPVLHGKNILELQELVRKVPASDYIIDFAVRIARNSRPNESEFEYVKRWVRWGAGPRASMFLTLAAKTRAILHGRLAPSVEDVRFVAYPVLRHRIIRSFTADADGISSDHIIERILEDTKE